MQERGAQEGQRGPWVKEKKIRKRKRQKESREEEGRKGFEGKMEGEFFVRSYLIRRRRREAGREEGKRGRKKERRKGRVGEKRDRNGGKGGRRAPKRDLQWEKGYDRKKTEKGRPKRKGERRELK